MILNHRFGCCICRLIQGTHDFRCFANVGQAESTIRTIDAARLFVIAERDIASDFWSLPKRVASVEQTPPTWIEVTDDEYQIHRAKQHIQQEPYALAIQFEAKGFMKHMVRRRQASIGSVLRLYEMQPLLVLTSHLCVDRFDDWSVHCGSLVRTSTSQQSSQRCSILPPLLASKQTVLQERVCGLTRSGPKTHCHIEIQATQVHAKYLHEHHSVVSE
jgi:hypothetical protein